MFVFLVPSSLLNLCARGTSLLFRFLLVLLDPCQYLLCLKIVPLAVWHSVSITLLDFIPDFLALRGRPFGFWSSHSSWCVYQW